MAPNLIPTTLSLLTLLIPAISAAYNVTCIDFTWRFGPKPPLADCKVALTALETEARTVPGANKDRVWGREVTPIPREAEKLPALWHRWTSKGVDNTKCEFLIDNVEDRLDKYEVFNYVELAEAVGMVLDNCLANGKNGVAVFPDGNVFVAPRYRSGYGEVRNPEVALNSGVAPEREGNSDYELENVKPENVSAASSAGGSSASSGSVTPFRRREIHAREWEA